MAKVVVFGVVAADVILRIPRIPARRAAETRTCTTTKWEVLVLADWLRCWQVSAVVMEPTSDYRKEPRVLRTWRSPRAGLITPLDAPTSVAKFSAVSCRRWSRRTGTHGSGTRCSLESLRE